MIKKAFLISELLIVFLFISCQQTDQDPTCQIGFCENNGTLIDCACECPQGFTGLNCEKIDFTQTQKLLDNEITPFELISSGVKLDSIYGKIYNYDKNIKPAPDPHYLLKKFNGNMEIQEYRKLLENERLLLVVDKPLSRTFPEIFEDNEDFLLNCKTLSKNNC